MSDPDLDAYFKTGRIQIQKMIIQIQQYPSKIRLSFPYKLIEAKESSNIYIESKKSRAIC